MANKIVYEIGPRLGETSKLDAVKFLTTLNENSIVNASLQLSNPQVSVLIPQPVCGGGEGEVIVIPVFQAVVRNSRIYCTQLFSKFVSFCSTETEMSSFWWNFNHWLHWKLSKWQLPVQPVMKISSNWRHFRFSVIAWKTGITFTSAPPLPQTGWGISTETCGSGSCNVFVNVNLIGLDDGMSPVRYQVIIWPYAGLMSIQPLGATFSEIRIKMRQYRSRKWIWIPNGDHIVMTKCGVIMSSVGNGHADVDITIALCRVWASIH